MCNHYLKTFLLLLRVNICLANHCVYDKYVKPREKVTDYRTWISGIRKKDLANGVDFETVRKEVKDLLQGRILVGHSINYDLDAIGIDHPTHMIRDTSSYEPFRAANGGRKPSLKYLSAKFLEVRIQDGRAIQ